MTKFVEQQNIPFSLPTYDADFDRILGKDPFLLIKGQLLFRNKKGQPVITHIDNKKGKLKLTKKVSETELIPSTVLPHLSLSLKDILT